MEQQRRDREAHARRLKQKAAEERRKAEIQARRAELEKQIKAVKRRAVSPTYSQGMKNARIRELQQQIDQLETKAAD
jgi:hypothetical protein